MKKICGETVLKVHTCTLVFKKDFIHINLLWRTRILKKNTMWSKEEEQQQQKKRHESARWKWDLQLETGDS